MIIQLPPSINLDPRIVQRQEPVLVQTFQPHPGIQGSTSGEPTDDIDILNTNIISRLYAYLRLILIVALILITLGADKVQAAAVCSNTPAAGDRVFCEELHASTNNININLDGVVIDTVAREERSVQGVHHGTGKITINVQDSSSTTQENLADSIFGWHAGTGDLDIDVQDFTSTTKGKESNGVFGWHTNMGDIDIDVWDFTSTIEGDYSYGIVGRHTHNTHGGDIDINVLDRTFVTTKGNRSHAVFGLA